MLFRSISQKALGKTLITQILSFFVPSLFPWGKVSLLPALKGLLRTPSIAGAAVRGTCLSVSGEHRCGSYFWSQGKWESVREGKDINVSPWGERLRIPSCLLICRPCQSLSILPEQRKEETDAEIITTLAKNLFLYPEGELQPHSCLQDRVKAFFPWYIAMAIYFHDKLKLTFILKRKIACCMKHLLTWHLPRTMG